MRPVLKSRLSESKMCLYGGVGSILWFGSSSERGVWELHEVVNKRYPLDHPAWSTIPRHEFGRQSYMSERKPHPHEVSLTIARLGLYL